MPKAILKEKGGGWKNEKKKEREEGQEKFYEDGGRRSSEELILQRSRGTGKTASASMIREYIRPSPIQHSMARPTPNGLTQAMQALRLAPSSTKRPSVRFVRRTARTYATEAQAAAAPEIDFSTFNRSPARIVPASPSYFSGNPRFIDHVLKLESLQAKYAALPMVPAAEAPRMAWFKLPQFRDFVGEMVPMKKYKSLVKILQRLNRIQPDLVPADVRTALDSFLRPGNPYAVEHVPRPVDENGCARAKGKRKESTAVVQLVEGEGEILVNGKSLVEMFQRVHDRESALWALRCCQRMDKYNAFITVKGGGVTGQAEAITLATARALLLHEPGLKPVLRRGRCPNPSIFYYKHLLTICLSWCYYCRCPSRRAEEAGSCQGTQDADLGQAVKRTCGTSDAFSISYLSCIIFLCLAPRVASSVLYPVLNAYGGFINDGDITHHLNFDPASDENHFPIVLVIGTNSSNESMFLDKANSIGNQTRRPREPSPKTVTNHDNQPKQKVDPMDSRELKSNS